MLAVGRNDVDAAWTRSEDISFAVDFHAVGNAGFGFGPSSSVEQHSAVFDRAVRFDIESQPDGIRAVRVTDVQLFLVGRESDAVGRFDLFGQDRELAVLRIFERPCSRRNCGAIGKVCGLRELRYGCVGPLRVDAGHVERGEHALGFAQVVPTNASDSDHREAIGALG